MQSDDWFTLAELTNRLGALVWVEENLANVLDQWVACESEASAAIHFATAGSHHRWHGEVIRGCLPTSPRLDAVNMILAPTSGWEQSVSTLSAIVEPDATEARLKALVKVVNPWLDREIGALLDLSRPISDAAMMRWLNFTTIDHDHDGEVAEMLLAAQASKAARFDDHRVISGLDLS